jgi:hypothetical protein
VLGGYARARAPSAIFDQRGRSLRREKCAP